VILYPARAIAARRTPAEWDPTVSLSSGLVLDLYPSDRATVTLSSGRVSAIADRSGNGRTYEQVTSAAQPADNGADALFGGRYSMGFAGAQKLASAASMPEMSTCTVALHFRLDSGLTGTNRLFDNGGAAANSFLTQWQTNVGGRLYNYYANASGQLDSGINPLSTFDVSHVLVLTIDPSQTYAPVAYLDGVRSIDADNGGAGGNVASRVWAIGSSVSGTISAMRGAVARFTVWDRVLTSTERAEVLEGLS
jgi:hypothetical protein